MGQIPAILFGAFFTISVAYSLGVLCFARLPLPHAVRFGLGAAIQSALVFVLLLGGAGNWKTFLACGAIPLLLLVKIRPARPDRTGARSLTRIDCALFAIVFGVYSVLYLANALAPEIQPDAMTYHLGLPAEYLHLGGFPQRIGFYEMIPQGMEMLFTFAFAFGKHSAAKLVHFAFLLGTPALFLAIGRKWELSDRVSLGAAALYFCAPVVGISGTSAYNDAALVFFILLTLYLLLAAKADPQPGYAIGAGIAAGFCYALKFNGLLIPPLALAFALACRWPWKRLLLLSAASALVIAPWMARDAILTGNPVAPLFNALFPNPYFGVEVERRLSAFMRSYGVFSLAAAPLDYLVRGRLQGIVGPVFVLLPIALLALRGRVGRVVWIAGAALSISCFWNVGARFWMPSLAFFAIALAMTLPKPLLWSAVLFQAIACWPAVEALYVDEYCWRLNGFPWRASLRLQSEPDYLRDARAEYQIAQMVESHTQPGSRVFSMVGLATAYMTREVVEFWHNTQADLHYGTLRFAFHGPVITLTSLRAEWPSARFESIRFRVAGDQSAEWRIREVLLFNQGRPAKSNSKWLLEASENEWQAAFGMDGNLATYWRSDGPVRRGAFYQIEFDAAQSLDRADLICENALNTIWEGRTAGGQWQLLADAPVSVDLPNQDLRQEAVRALRKGGFRYIVAPVGSSGNGLIGKALAEQPAAWGLADVARSGDVHLFEIL